MSDRIAYRRLPGIALSPIRRRTLYQGPDHILAVRTTLYFQEYRRFYYRDIQAIVIAEYGSAWTFYLIASAIFLLVMFVLLGYSWHPVWAALSAIGCVACFLVGMRIPNCYCLLKTATTTERLPSLGRKSAAGKAIAILQPLILQAQSAPPQGGA
jgi:hypothetical protein